MEPEKIGTVLDTLEIKKNRLENEKKVVEKEITAQEKQIVVKEKKHSTVPTSIQALELSLVFNTSIEEKEQGWCKRYVGNKRYIKAVAPNPNDPDTPARLIQEEDLGTLLGCFLMLKHARVKPDKYTFETSRYQISKVLWKNIGGNQYQYLKDSLDRLGQNNISTNFWWDPIKKKRVVRSQFHFLEDIDEGEEETLRITLSRKIVRSLEKGYLRFLEEKDLKDIIRLRGHAKVLALYLLQLVGNKPEQYLNLETVLKYLGIEEKYYKLPTKYFNLDVKKVVEPAVKKACKIFGYTSTYSKDKKQFHIQRKTQQMELPLPTEEQPRRVEQEETKKEPPEGQGNREHDLVLKQRRNNTFKALIRIGVDENASGKIFEDIKQEKLSLELVERQLEWFSYREKDSNPPGLFMSALYENWIMPAAYEKAREEILITRS